MPRSFLVKSKRAPLLGSASRRLQRPQSGPEEGAGSTTVRSRPRPDLLDPPCSPQDGAAVRSPGEARWASEVGDSPAWSADRCQGSEREQELERLVFMLLNHTSHTDLKATVSECPLCEKSLSELMAAGGAPHHPHLHHGLTLPLLRSASAADASPRPFAGFGSFSGRAKVRPRALHPLHLHHLCLSTCLCLCCACALPGAELRLQGLRESVQALVHAVHAPAHPLGHAALPVPVLREEVPPEVGHEEAHVHTHR